MRKGGGAARLIGAGAAGMFPVGIRRPGAYCRSMPRQLGAEMANRILVGNDWQVMDADYLEGAFAARTQLQSTYKAVSPESWQRGLDNERSRRHVRFGIDLLTAPDSGCDFGVDETADRIANPRSYRSQDPLDYVLLFMRATGALSAGHAIRDELGGLTPGAMRQALLARGVRVSTPFAQTVQARVRFERRSLGEALTPEEEVVVDGLKEPRRRFMLALGEVCTRMWDSPKVSKFVAHQADRSQGWTAGVTSKMAGDGEGFLFSHSVNGHIDITGKGWTAFRRLKAAPAEKLAAESESGSEPESESEVGASACGM
jgi:hypothetical protein